MAHWEFDLHDTCQLSKADKKLLHCAIYRALHNKGNEGNATHNQTHCRVRILDSRPRLISYTMTRKLTGNGEINLVEKATG